MEKIEIHLIPVSDDEISVSIDYGPDLVPVARRWSASRRLLDGIYADVRGLFQEALAEAATDFEIEDRKRRIAEELRVSGLALFQEIFRGECDRIRQNAEADGSGVSLIFKMDESIAYLPLEIMHDGTAFVSHRLPLGRVVYAQDAQPSASVARRAPYRVFLIGDPAEDPGIAADVEAEVDAIRGIFRARPEFSLDITVGRGADEKLMLGGLPGATVFHFTGHGVVGAGTESTGLRLDGGRVLTGGALAGLNDPPSLVFLNVCTGASSEAWKSSVGLVGTFLRRGSKACVASLWDLRSESAAFMASRFYEYVAGGQTFGEALRRARAETADTCGLHDPTWAAYTLYGDPRRQLVELTAEILEEIEKASRLRRALIGALAVFGAVAVVILFASSVEEYKPTIADRLRQQPAVTQPARLVGYMLIESEPADATIFVDGEKIGVTPYTYEVFVGTHRVVLEKQGYKRWEAMVDVKKSPRTEVKAELAPMERTDR